MNITTNRLKITFNIEAIQEDFVFLRLERQQNKKWYGFAALDHFLGQDFKATATLWQYGKYSYVMFKKPIDIYQLLSRIREHESFQDDAVIEVVPAISEKDSEKECIYGSWLAQILFNSLSSSKSRFTKYHFSNLTEKLLRVSAFKNKNKDCIFVAQIDLNKDYLLKISIKSYRTLLSVKSELKNNHDTNRKKQLQNALDKPYYQLLHSTTSTSLSRAPQTEEKPDAKSTYIECGLTGRKASSPFLEFDNKDNFDKSRAGIFYKIMSLINEQLSKYMSVELCNYEIEQQIPLRNNLLKKPKQLYSILKDTSIHIVDKVNTEDSSDISQKIKELLFSYIENKKLITIGKKDKKNCLNIRIIHESLYYEKNELEDQHLASTNDVKCQNITIESIETLGGDVETILLTIIKELIIKDDITNGSFTLFDWSQLNAKGVWTFADWDNTTDKIIFMEIQPNGMFEFRTIDGSDLFSYQEYSQYIELMTNSRTKKKVENLEGLIISDTQNINKILRTDEITIPNLEKIQNIINEVEELFPESLRTGEQWANYVQIFVDQDCTQTNINDFSKVVDFIEKLREVGGNEIDKNSFRRLLNDSLGKNSNVTELFREHLLSDKNIRIMALLNKK
jgi:hypothetical protein